MDEYQKWTTTKEYIMYPRAVCDEFNIMIDGYGDLENRMASILHDEKADISRGLEFRRGDTPTFKVMPLNSWVNRPDNRPEYLKRKKE